MEHLDVKSLLEKAVKSADSIIITTNKMKEGKIKAVDCNALTNGYRSAGNLYLSVVQAVEGSTLTLKSCEAPVELSKEDKDRLDKIAVLLGEKPSKRKAKKEGK
ncbi:MAG: hypothetical protein IJ468_00105 [Lachnospiraceae bacterium]|nr:hypothetical protein [Lachnospiraceae bacterium]